MVTSSNLIVRDVLKLVGNRQRKDDSFASQSKPSICKQTNQKSIFKYTSLIVFYGDKMSRNVQHEKNIKTNRRIERKAPK